jgi:hypothetical protein
MRIAATLVMVRAMALLMAACGGDPVPTCQQAVSNFYGVGCEVLDPFNNTPLSFDESLAECMTAIDVFPDQCHDELNEFLFCLDGVSTTNQCASCRDEQDAASDCLETPP